MVAGAGGLDARADCPPRRDSGALLREATPRANLVPDAHLAALAIEHGLTLCSTDGGFARFSGVTWQNPLRPAALPS